MTDHRKALTDVYGVQPARKVPRDVRMGAKEGYTVYRTDGGVLHGQEEAIPSSRFLEDQYDGEHLSVWGSYLDVATRRWGYACCQQTLRHCVCLADASKLAESKKQLVPLKKELKSDAGPISVAPGEIQVERVTDPNTGYTRVKGIAQGAQQAALISGGRTQAERDRLARIRRRHEEDEVQRLRDEVRKRRRLDTGQTQVDDDI